MVGGGTCLYLRKEILSSPAFAQRTEAALRREPVRRVVAREITVQVIDRNASDLIAARPLITSALETIVATPQFAHVIRLAAEQGHRLLFVRGDNVAFSVADAGTVVVSALRTLSPRIAREIPRSVDARLLDLRRRSFAVSTLRVADKIKTLGLWLPLAGALLFALAIAIAPRRRAAITRCASALGVAGVALFVDLLLVRHHLLANLFGSQELTNADVRSAAAALWDAYLGDLSRWALGVGVAGAIVAGASSSLLRPYTATAGFARLRKRMWPPRTRAARVVRGALALVVGAWVIAEPTLVVDIVAVLGGAALLYFGAGELLSGTGTTAEQQRPSFARSRPAMVAIAAALALLIGVPALVFALNGRSTARASARGPLTCNGYAQLCTRRVNEVVFAGTHNAMSAADSPGWFIANQSHGIARQLDDGIRAFKISTHYGVGSAPGHVRTDIAAEGEKLNRVSEKLSGRARSALQRFSAAVGFGPPKGKRAIWLCHTLCELGATSMVSFMSTIREFLERNPGQVLILFDEDYVSEADLERTFKQARLFGRLATLRPGAPLPTLRELVRAHHNVLVFTQEPVSGRYPWDMYGFSWIQDTPLKAVKPSQFSCRLYRGSASNPLLMMNNWADVFPPRRSPNVALNSRSFILHRARQCISERDHIPNLILTDFYNSGDVVGAARMLNHLGDQAPAPIVPLEQPG